MNRKTIGLDSELVNKLKEVASKRGVTLSNYLRMLISEALMLEELGHYAPRALRERRIEYILENLGFIFVPKQILGNSGASNAEEVGVRIGLVAKELGIQPLDLIELLSRSVGNAVIDSNKIVLIKSPSDLRSLIADLIKGISASTGLEVQSSESMIVIKIPREVIAASLQEFSEKKSRRRSRGKPPATS